MDPIYGKALTGDSNSVTDFVPADKVARLANGTQNHNICQICKNFFEEAISNQDEDRPNKSFINLGHFLGQKPSPSPTNTGVNCIKKDYFGEGYG